MYDVAHTWAVIAGALFGAWSIALSIVDIRSHRLPNRWVLAATATVVPALLMSGSTRWIADASRAPGAGERAGATVLLDTVAVAGALGLGFWLLWRFAPSGLGGGDVKLAPLIGAMLGFAGGWQGALIGVFAAFVAAAAWGLVMRARRPSARAAVAFAPCLCLGAWLVIWIFGQ
ncbi:prepilin peptidase [Leucobacter musarum]|uniref:prepilin peptidase n=1 Tax=Leucobacter musarum TaxID=1930747 RepID=UPI0006A7742F|nr:prepilin peptidase [Leucobacter musarum]